MNEIRWCDHVKVTQNPIFGTSVPHAGVRCDGLKGFYLVIEAQTVKVLCPSCFRVGLIQPPPLFV